eukprot:Nk52_evm16s241 gene=Nk52_evmTU16s241
MVCCCIVGYSGAGKTFSGDYLEQFHGVSHVNGDVIMHSKEDAYKQLTVGLRAAFDEYWFLSRAAPPELWQPYYDELIALVKEAQKDKEHVCLTFAAYHPETRVYLQERIPGLVFIVLDMNGEALIARHTERFKKYAEAQGQSIAEAFEKITKRTYSREEYVSHTKSLLRGLDIPGNIPEKNIYTLSFGEEGVNLKQLCQVLGLPETHTDLSEQEVKDIAQINYKRFETFSIE